MEVSFPLSHHLSKVTSTMQRIFFLITRQDINTAVFFLHSLPGDPKTKTLWLSVERIQSEYLNESHFMWFLFPQWQHIGSVEHWVIIWCWLVLLLLLVKCYLPSLSNCCLFPPQGGLILSGHEGILSILRVRHSLSRVAQPRNISVLWGVSETTHLGSV